MEKNVQVAVRIRPMNEREKASQRAGVVSAQPKSNQITAKKKTYTFDRVFGQYATQKDVFKGVVQNAVDEALSGFNCTVFAYGQTGTGKTHTMQGVLSPNHEDSGIIPRSVNYIFEKLQATKSEYSVRVSFLQLYNEECKDLLGEKNKDKPLRLMEDIKRGGVYCQNLEEITTLTASHVFELLEMGAKNRISAETLLNDHSSRSHCIFTIRIHSKESNIAGEDILRSGTLNLVDLAGSECIGRSGARNARAREAGNINQSLLTLGRVITALVDKYPHVPYRDSKLTRLLQESLGGKAMTTIIATVGPGGDCVEETLSTLDYANRAKNIKNKPEANQRMTKHVLIREYGQEIDALRSQLIAARNKDGIYLPAAQFSEMQERIAGLGTQLVELEEELERKGQNILELEDTLEMAKQENQETQVKLTNTEEQLRSTEDTLSATKSQLVGVQETLQKTQQELQISRDNEAHLLSEASIAAKLYQQRLDEIQQLQSKIERKQAVLSQNRNCTVKFVDETKAMNQQSEATLNDFQTKHDSVNLTTVATDMAGMKTNIQKSLDSILATLNDRVSIVRRQEEVLREKIDSESTSNVAQLAKIDVLVASQSKELQATVDTIKNTTIQLVQDVQNQLAQSTKTIEQYTCSQSKQINAIKESLARSLNELTELNTKEKSQVVDSLKSTQDELQNQVKEIQKLMQTQLDACVSSVVQSLSVQSGLLERQSIETKSRLHGVCQKVDTALDAACDRTKQHETHLMEEFDLTKTHLEVFERNSEHNTEEIIKIIKDGDGRIDEWRSEMKQELSGSTRNLQDRVIANANECQEDTKNSEKIISNLFQSLLDGQNNCDDLVHKTSSAMESSVSSTLPKVENVRNMLRQHVAVNMKHINDQNHSFNNFMDNLQQDEPTGSTPFKEKKQETFPSFQVTEIKNSKRKNDEKENVMTSRIQPPKKYLKQSESFNA